MIHPDHVLFWTPDTGTPSRGRTPGPASTSGDFPTHPLSRQRASASQPVLCGSQASSQGFSSVAGMSASRLVQLQSERGLTRSGGVTRSDSVTEDLQCDTHVSLVDNDGASGVGLAAAAAVSAAAARAWASAASKQQRNRNAEGFGSSNSLASARGHSKAGFKLVASVYRDPPITRAGAAARAAAPSPSLNAPMTTQASSSSTLNGGRANSVSVAQLSGLNHRSSMSPAPSSSSSESSSSLVADAGGCCQQATD